MNPNPTRGMRLNNPGNIRIGDTPWHGKVKPSRDPAFETFDSMRNGVRALALQLLTDFIDKGLATIEAIIKNYAPSSENDTEAYIKAVSDRTGFTRDAHLCLTGQHDLTALVYAVIHQEQGQVFMSWNDIDGGVLDALKARGL